MRSKLYRTRRIVILSIAFLLLAGAASGATFTVNSTGDLSDSNPGNGGCFTIVFDCTLRAAIEEANGNAGTDTIVFAIVGPGVKSIVPNSAYPDITEAVIIDGWSQGGVGYTGPPLIQLNGVNIFTSDTLRLAGGNSTVRGLTINRFYAAIRIFTLGGNTIHGCYLGTDVTGTVDLGNGFGVFIDDAPDNTVGGVFSYQRNVISGNTSPIYVFGSLSTGTRIRGNYIGTSAAGDAALHNSTDVGISNAADVTIGGTLTSERNVITSGVNISDSSNVVVSGNYIGTDASGLLDFGSGLWGVEVETGSTNTRIGGTTDGERNVISGFTEGIRIEGATTSGVQVIGNYIGTDATGALSLGNSWEGVQIIDSPNNTIGGPTEAERNVISGNYTGISIEGATATGNSVMGNYIGTDASGFFGLGNGEGVSISQGASGNRVGGTVAGEGNLIAFNDGAGVRIEQAAATGNAIRHNSIYRNGSIGIDLAAGSDSGVTENDSGDVDAGGNNFQNFPVITDAVNNGGNTDVSISFNSTPATQFFIDVYTSSSCNSSGHGEGETYLGSTTRTTNGSGNVTFTFSPPTQLPLGTILTATATRSVAPFDTSEFSECVQVINPFPPNVINTNDSGPGSLRQTITDTNLLNGLDVIRFNIPGSGVHTINLLSPLPTITDEVIIDGRTQPGFTGSPLIELNGTLAGAGADGLNITSGGTTVRGLIINRFGGDGIELVSGLGNTITGNMIGTDSTGTIDLGNSGHGIFINGSENNRVGGGSIQGRNLISGNDLNGIYILNSVEIGNQIIGNIIGTDITRSVGLGNLLSGIYINSAARNIIGGTAAGTGNVISGNGANGIRLRDAYSNEIKRNFIGTNDSGALALGNTLHGVRLEDLSTDNTIGDASGDSGNTIAFNTDGINVGDLATGNAIRGNSFFSNLNLGIDLAPNGKTPNDDDDADTGANNLQNFPVLTTTISQAGTTIVQGSLNSTPDTPFTIALYSSTSCDSSGNGEGENYIGSTVATTDANGDVLFSFSPTAPIAFGRFITATATRNDYPLDTSEFSQSAEVVEGPGNLTLSSTSFVADENAGVRTVTVNRTDGANGTITVDYATSDGGAVAGEDYTPTTGTLTFLDGETVKTFDIPIIDDTLDEPMTQSFNVTLSNASPNVSITPRATALVIIVDNDETPVISIDDISAGETNIGSIVFTFTVQLSNPSSSTVTINYATANGTATSNSDYLPTSGQLSFAPGEVSKTISVLVLGDLVVELNEVFFVNLTSPTNATFGDAQGLGTIIDDDNPGRFAFALTPYSGTEGSQVIATVSRTNGVAGTVSVDYSTSGGTATPFSDYTPTSGTLIFGDGETTKTFMVDLLDDASTEPSESFNVSLSNPIGGSSLGTPAIAAVNILDNDSGTLFTISGRILKTDSTPLAGATVTMTGTQSAVTTTDSLGQYAFTNVVPNGPHAGNASAIGYTFTPASWLYSNLTGDITNADFTATAVPGRQLRIIGGTAPPTQDITAAIELVSQGDENAVGFSINYDASLLMNPTVMLNPDAVTASLVVNDTQAGTGKLGIVIALPAGQSFAAGTRSLVSITFNTAATGLYSSPVTFGDVPTFREIANTNADTLPANYVDGAVTFAQGWEADLAPRPTGSNNGTITVADFTQVGRFAAGLDTDYSLNELQRADCTPRVGLGNGSITVSDYTQAGRYAANLDPATPAGGPSAFSGIGIAANELLPFSGAATPVRAVGTIGSAGQQTTVSIEVDAQGGENGFGFTLNYAPAALSNPVVTLGSGIPLGSALIPNTTTPGRVGVIVGLPFGVGLTPGTKQLVTIRFDVAANAPAGPSVLAFGDVPVVREVSDVNAVVLTSTFQDGGITIFAPTAANVAIGGRVVDANGQAVSNAQILMTDMTGNVRMAMTNGFGFYRLDGVTVGQTYVFEAVHKRHQFMPRTFAVHDATDNLNFAALP